MSLVIAVTTIERPQVIQRFVRSVRRHYPDVPIYVADQSRNIEPMLPFYGAHQATLIRMPYDAGVTASRNRLVAAMDQDYFVLCDDDFLFGAETRFSDAIKILEANPEIGVVGGKLYDFDGSAEHPRHWELFFDYDQRNHLLITTPIYNLAPVVQEVAGIKFYLCDAVMNFAVFRRSIFTETVRWDERFKSNGEHEDFYLNLKVNSHIRVAYLPTMVGYHHRSERYDGYHRRLRGREEGWAEFLLKWNLHQHLEIGYGVRSIADVGAVFDAQQARERFFLNGPLSLRQEEVRPGGLGIGQPGEISTLGAYDRGEAAASKGRLFGRLLLPVRGGKRVAVSPTEPPAEATGTDAGETNTASLRRKYALEPDPEGTAIPAPGDHPVFFRYSAIRYRDGDFSLWYRCSAPGTDPEGYRLPVWFRWYAVDGRVLVWDTERKILDLAETAYWTPLLLDVPLAPPGSAILRFEIVAETGPERTPIGTGFLLCSADDAAAEQTSSAPDVLAFESV